MRMVDVRIMREWSGQTGNRPVIAEIAEAVEQCGRVPHARRQARGVSVTPLMVDRKPVASGRLAYDLKHDLPRVLARCQRISDDLIAFVG